MRSLLSEMLCDKQMQTSAAGKAISVSVAEDDRVTETLSVGAGCDEDHGPVNLATGEEIAPSHEVKLSFCEDSSFQFCQ